MRISQSYSVHNIHGKTDRIERGPDVKHFKDVYQHVTDQVLVREPKIENIDRLVVIHDTVDQYA